MDVVTARTEFYDAPAALPTVEHASIREDLFRRDFTINAMAVSLKGDDRAGSSTPSAGRRDLQTGTIRVLHNLSFIDDPTRIFRAIRYENRYGFRMDEHTRPARPRLHRDGPRRRPLVDPPPRRAGRAARGRRRPITRSRDSPSSAPTGRSILTSRPTRRPSTSSTACVSSTIATALGVPAWRLGFIALARRAAARRGLYEWLEAAQGAPPRRGADRGRGHRRAEDRRAPARGRRHRRRSLRSRSPTRRTRRSSRWRWPTCRRFTTTSSGSATSVSRSPASDVAELGPGRVAAGGGGARRVEAPQAERRARRPRLRAGRRAGADRDHVILSFAGSRPARTRLRSRPASAASATGAFESLNLGILTGDEPERVIENRRLLCCRGRGRPGSRDDGVAAPRPRCRQGDRRPGVMTPGSTQSTAGTGSGPTSPACTMMLITADCLPVALARTERCRAPALAVLHVGWRGLLAGIVAAAVGRSAGAARRRHRPWDRAVLLRGRRGGRRSVPRPLRAESLVGGSSTSGRRPRGRCTRRAARGRARRALHLCHPDLFFSHRRDGGRTGRQGIVARSADEVRARYERVREEVGPSVTVVAATKYVSRRGHGRPCGGRDRGRGREQGPGPRSEARGYGDAFRWHFIGHLQSRKAKVVNGLCELVPFARLRVGGETAGGACARPGQPRRGGDQVRMAPADLRQLPRVVRGSARPDDDAARCGRPRGFPALFRQLRVLAEEHGLHELSMGTSQDYKVAAEEGATYVRVGARLFSG